MRILIFGVGGFIGSHLAHDFAERYEVGCVSTRPPTQQSGVHFQICATSPNFHVVISEFRPDVCIACFGAANPGASFAQRDRDFDLNVLKLRALLEAVRISAPGARVIHLSSAAVYGNPLQLPIQEAAPFHPISPYGWHKRQAELICEEYSIVGDVPTLSFRIFSAYGPGLQRQILWDAGQRIMAAEAAGVKALTMSGTGIESRDFIYISDLVRAIETGMLNSAFTGEQINVANGEEISIRRAVETMARELEWRGEITFSGVSRPGDPINWRADISRLATLGYEPNHSFDHGVKRLASWMRGMPDGSQANIGSHRE